MAILTEAGMNFYCIRSDKPAGIALQEKIAELNILEGGEIVSSTY